MKNKIFAVVAACLLTVVFVLYCLQGAAPANEKDVEILRVYNWEEYISESKDDETIDVITQFEKYCKETLKRNVKVEYSTFGTNENMYNELNLSKKKTANGVTYSYDLVCPSEYMLLKMMREGMLEKLDINAIPDYRDNASPYIQNLFKSLKNEGSDESLYDYAACYMWGTMGYVYNPEIVSDEDAKHWNLLWNDKYKGKGTIKDSVRDSYILAVGYCLKDELDVVLGEYESSGKSDNDKKTYNAKLTEIFNRTDEKTVNTVGKALTELKDKIYGYEVDSGKKEMAQGKIAINFAWSGDAVYTLDEAEAEDADGNSLSLRYAVPEEGSNIFFDGWAMPKGAKKDLAQAFINFVEKPENACLNMDYIGYTSSIGGEVLYENAIDWYGSTAFVPSETTKDELSDMSEEELEYYFVDGDTVYESVYIGDYVTETDGVYSYVSTTENPLFTVNDDEELEEITEPVIVNMQDLTYFFKTSETDDYKYVVYYDETESLRQFETQYPSEEVVNRCTVMKCFTDDETRTLNNMWETAKVGNTNDAVLIVTIIIIVLLVTAAIVFYNLYKKGIIFRPRIPQGYTFKKYE